MFLIAAGRLFNFVLLFAAIKLLTSLLSPEEVARVYLVMSLVGFFVSLLIGSVGMYINRHLHVWNENGWTQQYYNYYWGYLLVVCTLAALLLTLLAGLGSLGYMAGGWFVFLVVVMLLSLVVNQTTIPGLNMFNYRGWYVSLSLLTAIVSLASSSVLVLYFSPEAEFWISGQAFGHALLAVIGGVVFYSRLSSPKEVGEITKEQIKNFLHFVWPISVAVGMGWAQTQGYRFVMESGLGLYELGLFAAGYGISAGIISAIDSVFATYLQPIFYKRISRGDAVEQGYAWSEYAGIYFPSLILASLLISVLAPELARVMLGPEFQSSFQFVVWGAVAETARISVGVYGLIAHASMNTRLLLVPNFIGALTAIFFVWVLMPIYGATGVGVALALASVISLLVMRFSTRGEFVVSLRYKKILVSLVMGGALWALSESFQKFLGERLDLSLIIFKLATIGVIFLIFQYMLLRSLLQGNYRYE